MPTSRNQKKKSPASLCSPVPLCVKDFAFDFDFPLRRLQLPILVLAALTLHAQTAPPNSGATFQAKARVVIEDIVVTNNKGEPIPGLHKEDFEISEDSTPQTIATFEEHTAATVTPYKLPPMPPHVYTNFPLIEKADSLNVLLLDSLNTPVADQNYVHQQMIKYLATIPPGTRVAVFTLASRLRMLQGATTDSAALLAVLNNKKNDAGTHASPLLASNAESDADKEHINFMESESMSPVATNLTSVQAAVDPINSIKQFLADTTAYETDSRTRLTLDSLQQLARYLSDTPGRKNVLWFSGSFPTGILPNPDLPDASSVVRSYEAEVRRTTALLASSQVALYPIAAEGLSTDAVYQANGGAISEKRPSLQERDLVKQMQSDSVTRDSNHTIMEILAEDTGGTAFYNTNGLSDALTRVINNGTRYYTLTYTPADPHMDGKFRHIHVKLRDAKYKLAYRRGYFADPTLLRSQKADNDPLMPFMARNFPDVSQIIYKISVTPAKTQPAPDAPRAGANQDLKGPVTRYAIDFAVAVQDLKLDPTPDGGRHGNIEVMLIAYDRDGKPINMVTTKGDLNLQPKIYASMIKLGLQMHKEIDVPQTPIYLRTGIYDLASDTAGTLGLPLTESQAAPTTATK
jgi:VWFA-related protein